MSSRPRRLCRSRTLTPILMVAALTAVPVAAQNMQRGDHRPPPPPVETVLDGDDDGLLSSGELAAAASALIELDGDGDGALSLAECLPPPPDGAPESGRRGDGPGGRGHRPPQPPVLTALDLDGSGLIEPDELAVAEASLLTLDRDRDGQLSPDEYRPRPPRQAHGQRQDQSQPHRQ